MALTIKPNFSQSLNNLGVVYTVQVCSSTIIYDICLAHILIVIVWLHCIYGLSKFISDI
jgi:predicted Abi (CAAX) family protease